MSVRRLAVAAVLGAWAALFWWLLVTGRSSLYLSTRTAWVVPVGAVLLTIAAAGRALTGRDRAPLDARAAWTLALIVAPAIAVAALPPATLGSYAAGRRSSFSSASVSAGGGVAGRDITLADVAAAQSSGAGMRALARRAGSEVTFIGFVGTDQGMPADELRLTRFVVACCVADALSVHVRVVNAPPGRFHQDDWVQVTGRLYPVGKEAVVVADSIEKTKRPDDPYLTP